MKDLELTKEILHTKVSPYDFNTSELDLESVAREMYEFMGERNGIGLAANQVGLDLRMFVMASDPILACVNPRITAYSDEHVVLDEGCLSYPGLFIKIRRPRWIRVRFQDLEGNRAVKRFDGMASRVFQHELDHLDGIDFRERAGKVAMRLAKQKAKKRKKKARR